ncbi:unnamed protein product [Medioppia subpectinata]|uniref:Uncharacterized protein n=1 Tax=Medioppia subpectinata TaxID=1979941 RepID=A0A7R9KNE5_9ACAR|nr:unnamed protein product [Medioppia subpectinata]CAG2106783.1 unnamed protein product [Medioppia subpectinata]
MNVEKPVVFLYDFNNYTIIPTSGGFYSYFANECVRYLSETFPPKYIRESRQLVAVMLEEDTGDSHPANGSIAIFRRIDANTNTFLDSHYLSEDLEGVRAHYDLGDNHQIVSLIKYNKQYTNDTWRDMTHDLFLRCDERRAPFSPFDFCEQNYNFDNILSLGNDLYFQRNTSFWRLKSYGFTSDSYPTGSPLKSQNIQNLVFDSHFGPFLETEGFDTSQRVFGFSYKAMDRFPCGHFTRDDDYSQCVDKYSKSPYFHSVCLYGTVNRMGTAVPVFSIDNGYFKSYIHTPGGLERPIIKEGDRHRQFCKAIADYVRFDEQYVIRIGFGVTHITGYQTGGRNQISIAQTIAKLKGVGSHLKDTDFAVYSMSFEYFYIKNGHSLDYKTFDQKLNVTRKVYYIPAHHDNFIVHSLFRYKNVSYCLVGYGRPHTRYLYSEDFKRKPPPDSPKHPIILWFDKTNEIEWSTVVTCPIEMMRYSVVSNYLEGQLCLRKPTYNIHQSVLNIGPALYHQTGLHFYYYDIMRKKFIFDRHVTELLATYFDTRHRVTGYSIELLKGDGYYDVTIHGRSSFAYRPLGKYIYGLFMYVYKDKDTKTLMPVVKPSDYLSGTGVTRLLFSLGPHRYDGLFDHQLVLFAWQLARIEMYQIVTTFPDKNLTMVVHHDHSQHVDAKQVLFPFIATTISKAANYYYQDMCPFDKFIGAYFDYDNITHRKGAYLVATDNISDTLYLFNMLDWGRKPYIEIDSMYNFRKTLWSYFTTYCPLRGPNDYDFTGTILVLILILSTIIVAFIAFKFNPNNSQTNKKTKQ